MLGRFVVTRPMLPWDPPELDVHALEPSRLIPGDCGSMPLFGSLSPPGVSHCNPLHFTAWTACANPNPCPYQMFSFPMAISGGSGPQQRSRGVAVCRRLAPWSIVRKKLSGILVGPSQKNEKGRKIPALAPVEYTAVIFW